MSSAKKSTGNPPGAPPKHHARWLARRLKDLDKRTGPAKLLKARADELADDAGGWSSLTNRESVLVQRTAALLVLCETIENYVFTQESPFTESRELLPVLAKNYIAYSNTVRLNLLALGLKPERTKTPTLSEYLAQRSAGSGQNGAGTRPSAAPTATPTNGAQGAASGPTQPTASTETESPPTSNPAAPAGGGNGETGAC